ncbi:MAG: LysM domain-containing protein [Anaerolineae bacterium]|jgi:LysM repeat protein
MWKRLIVCVPFLALLVGCGQLITPSPELMTPVVILPSATPLATVPPRATFTPAPATPAPTATPTVTPTPIVYRVQSGDTLLAIAAEFGVSAEAIQEANGIIDPRRLQIEQELVIPRPKEDAEQPPTPTPTPPSMLIRGLGFQQMPVGGLWALGEIYNPGAVPLSEVVVEVSLFDGSGQLLASEAAFPQLDVVPSEQAVSFAILFPEPPRQFAQYQALVLAGVPTSPNTRYYLDLAASDLQGQAVGATRYRVTGQLQNVGSSDAENLRLLVTAYDDQARICAVRQADLPVLVLRSSATTPFEVELTLTGSPVVTYSVQAQGLRVE